jgi:hypothetical protein
MDRFTDNDDAYEILTGKMDVWEQVEPTTPQSDKTWPPAILFSQRENINNTRNVEPSTELLSMDEVMSLLGVLGDSMTLPEVDEIVTLLENWSHC